MAIPRCAAARPKAFYCLLRRYKNNIRRDLDTNRLFCYHLGQGVRRDYAEAVKWFRRAAEQGLAQAQGNLGACYAKGLGVPQDYVEAYAWFVLAEENTRGGNPVAARSRAAVVGQFTSPAELARGRERADELRELIAENRRKAAAQTNAVAASPLPVQPPPLLGDQRSSR